MHRELSVFRELVEVLQFVDLFGLCKYSHLCGLERHFLFFKGLQNHIMGMGSQHCPGVDERKLCEE